MARHAKTLPAGTDNTQHLSMGVLGLCLPASKIQEIIDSCGKASKRIRDLPAVVMVYYVISLSLFPGVSYTSVLGWLTTGLQWLNGATFRVNCKGSLSAGRARLGAEPVRLIHEQMALPMEDKNIIGSYWKGMHLVAMDGSTLALQDTESNSVAYGRSSNQNGKAAYPLARFVALVEIGTHIIFSAKIGKYTESEIKLAANVIPRLKTGMICLADRLFSGFHLWKQASSTGAHLLWRAKIDMKLIKTKSFPDGSYLARWDPSKNKKSDPNGLIVRVVEYRLKGGASDKDAKDETVYRLITTILDPKIATAKELAELYPQRWEIEITIKEGKRILRHGQVTLRSKVAELVEQEFWGLLLAHYITRKMMAVSAVKNKIDPDSISYTGCVEIIKSNQAGAVLSFSPKS
jgi:hypothetical protein